MCLFRNMKTLRRLVRCWIIVFVVILLVSEGQTWPQNFGGSNLRSPPIGDNKLPGDNTVPLSTRPSPGRQPAKRPDAVTSRSVDSSRVPRLPADKKPDKPAATRPASNGRTQDSAGLSVVDFISNTMLIAQSEGRRPDSGPRPNWNQATRPTGLQRPTEGRPSHSEPGSRGTQATSNFTFPKRTPNKQVNNRPDAGNPIVFPDLHRFVPSESCVKSGRTFCETSSDYPAEYIAKVLDTTASRFGSLFGADEVEAGNINVTQRFDLPPDDETLCRSIEKVIYPTAGQTRDDQWRFIVNQEKFLQGVRIEMCIEEEGKCMFSDSFPFGYTTFCKQKYIYRKLVSVTEDGTSTTDEFKLPSCCSCHIRVDTSMRMASDITPTPARKKRKRRRELRGRGL